MITPAILLTSRARELAALLPAVATADVDAVHDARVITRRLRELLPLTATTKEVEDDTARLRHAGRVLGSVRELDVLDAILASLASRARFAATTIAELRGEAHQLQERARRRMVKVLEETNLEELCLRRSSAVRVPTGWIDHLRVQLGRRAQTMQEALQRAGGVYMPNRTHQARIAIKRLRYAVEIADETRLWNPPHLLKDLRRAQGLLGEIHDFQILFDRVEHRTAAKNEQAEEAGWLLDWVRADLESGYRKSLPRLAQLYAAASACDRWSRRVKRPWRGAVTLALPAAAAAASAFLAPSVAHALDQHRSAAASSSDGSRPIDRPNSVTAVPIAN